MKSNNNIDFLILMIIFVYVALHTAICFVRIAPFSGEMAERLKAAVLKTEIGRAHV